MLTLKKTCMVSTCKISTIDFIKLIKTCSFYLKYQFQLITRKNISIRVKVSYQYLYRSVYLKINLSLPFTITNYPLTCLMWLFFSSGEKYNDSIIVSLERKLRQKFYLSSTHIAATYRNKGRQLLNDIT